MAVPVGSTQPKVQGHRRGRHGTGRASGVLPGSYPKPTRTVAAQPRDHTAPQSEWSAEEQAAFHTWLRVYAEATDPDRQAQAQASLVHLMIAGDRLFLWTRHLSDYDERRELYQETLVYALRQLSWLWTRFGMQAEIEPYLRLCLRTVRGRHARQPLLLPLEHEPTDPTRDVETHVAHAEYTTLLRDLATALRTFVQEHAARWNPQAATWFEALYVAGHSEVAIARQARVSREHVHRTVRAILQDPALMVWLDAYFTARLGCALSDALHALTTPHARHETPLRPLIQTLFQWRALYEDDHHA